MSADRTLPPSYFERLYAADADPWGFAQRWYEQRRYAVTLAALPEPRYHSAYEPGCSVGVLTRALADRCDAVLAADVSPRAVAAATARVADCPHVRVERHGIPAGWPPGAFDLVVLSEVLYYLGTPDLHGTLDRAVASVAAGGTLLAVHWRHPAPDYPQTGDRVHGALAETAAAASLGRVVEHREDDFLLDVWTAPRVGELPGRTSVAARTGLL